MNELKFGLERYGSIVALLWVISKGDAKHYNDSICQFESQPARYTGLHRLGKGDHPLEQADPRVTWKNHRSQQKRAMCLYQFFVQ